jgi:hypothetical protein
VFTVNVQQLGTHIPLTALPRRLGGSNDIDHRAWIVQCLQAAWHKTSAVDDEREERILSYVASIVPLSPSDVGRPSISSFSPGDGVWDTESLSAALGPDDCDASFTSSLTGEPPISPYTMMSRKRSIEQSPPPTAEVASDSLTAVSPMLLTSPPPAKRRQPTDDGSIHGPDTGGLTIQELVEYCRIKGQRGLIKEYKNIKEEAPDGTFEVSKSVFIVYPTVFNVQLTLY